MFTAQERPSQDAARAAVLRGSITLYLAAGVLCLLAEVLLLRLWNADLHVPFYYSIGSDQLTSLMLAKNIGETGSFRIYPRLGAPGSLDHHDYPAFDNLHYYTLKLIASFSPDPGVVLNVFYLLTFLLITWTSLYAMRRLGISGPVSVVASLLYAFAPYHLIRCQMHVFLGAYLAIPPLALLLLRLSEGRPLFVGWDTPVRRWFVGVASLITCILVAGSGVYAVAFGIYFIVVASLIGFSRDWRGVRLVDGALAAALVLGLLVVQAVPNIQYGRAHGKNPSAVRREAGESVQYALSIASMVKPTPYHQGKILAQWALRRGPGGEDRARELDELLKDETRFVALGVFATCGFLIVVLVPFLVRLPAGMSSLLDPLGKLTLAGLLLGVPGGLGYLVASNLTPNIRAYNRVSIHIAYFSALGAALLLDYLRRRISAPHRRHLFDALLGAILVLGLFDQMPRIMVPDYQKAAGLYARDRDYFGRVEASLPAGSMVFQLPYAAYPEGFSNAREVEWSYLGYEHIRAFLHTDRLRWSSPAMKGREADLWQARLWEEAPDLLVADLILAGFRGISIDRDGYEDRADDLIDELGQILGPSPLESPDHRFAFFPLPAAKPAGRTPEPR